MLGLSELNALLPSISPRDVHVQARIRLLEEKLPAKVGDASTSMSFRENRGR